MDFFLGDLNVAAHQEALAVSHYQVTYSITALAHIGTVQAALTQVTRSPATQLDVACGSLVLPVSIFLFLRSASEKTKIKDKVPLCRRL
jgi:hypothetical protein